MTSQSHGHPTISSIVWSVPSATTKGVTYEVRAESETGVLFCNCLAATNRRACWHIRACAAGIAGKPTVRATVHTRPALADVTCDDLYR